MGWVILLVVVVVGVVAWRNRVTVLSKLLGQSEDRVRRQIERRKR